MPSSAPTTIRSFADTVPAAAARAAEIPDFWTGFSGETVTGAEVAEHIAAAQALLLQRGWSRTFDDPAPELPEPDESMSVKALLLGLVRAARSALTDSGPLTLPIALGRTQDTAGDQDTWGVAGRILNVLVAVHTGVRHASHDAWTSKRHRMWAEVNDLLTAGVDFARAHGPRA